MYNIAFTVGDQSESNAAYIATFQVDGRNGTEDG